MRLCLAGAPKSNREIPGKGLANVAYHEKEPLLHRKASIQPERIDGIHTRKRMIDQVSGHRQVDQFVSVRPNPEKITLLQVVQQDLAELAKKLDLTVLLPQQEK